MGRRLRVALAAGRVHLPALRPATRSDAAAGGHRHADGLEEALQAARERNLGAMGHGELQFGKARDEAKLIAREIGFRC